MDDYKAKVKQDIVVCDKTGLLHHFKGVYVFVDGNTKPATCWVADEEKPMGFFPDYGYCKAE